jgi:hypothetical protein
MAPPFASHIIDKMVTFTNPKGTINDSDLELAAIVAQHIVLAQQADVREATIISLFSGHCVDCASDGVRYSYRRVVIMYIEEWKFASSPYVEHKKAVNTSGKAGAQIPHLPLGDDSSPWGR